MSQTLQVGKNRIDRPSQIILGALNEEEWMFGEPLRDAAELGQNQQVFYRMNTHLLPAGLVEERPREDRPPGYEQARQFRLTEAGADWVDDHTGEIARPATREETQQMAVEARDDAASAKASVQNYRKKLSRMKGHVEDIGEEVAEIDRRHAHDYEQVGHIHRVTQKAHRRTFDNESSIEEVRHDLDGRAAVEEVEELREDVRSVERTLTDVEETLNGVVGEQVDAERARARLRELATPARYLGVSAVGAVVGAYLIVLVWTVVAVPGMVIGVVLAGIGAVLGVVVSIAMTI